MGTSGLMASGSIAAAGALIALFGFASAVPAAAQDEATLAIGKQVWEDGGCASCHGLSGQGGTSPDYPAGPSLRTTGLDAEGLFEAIACGRPATQMAAWLAGAYTEHSCYGWDPGPPPERTVVIGAFSTEQVQALVEYIEAEFVQR